METSTGASVELTSTITCPARERQTTGQMPENACTYFFECPSCRTMLKPKPGDCCVFCSYGDVPCPPIQLDQRCCGG